MMGVKEVVDLSRGIARGIDDRLTVKGVMSAAGGRSYTELLVTIAGCHAEPCSLVVHVDRSDPLVAEQQLTERLTAAIARHLAS